MQEKGGKKGPPSAGITKRKGWPSCLVVEGGAFGSSTRKGKKKIRAMPISEEEGAILPDWGGGGGITV